MNKTIAREILNDIERKVKLGQHNMVKVTIPTLAEFSKNYLKHVRDVVRKRSWQRDELCLKHLLSFFGFKKLDNIHPKDVDDYKHHRLKKVKPATVNRELEVFRHMFNLAERWNLFFGKNPASISGLIKTDSKMERILSIEEEARLLEVSPPYLRNIIICALHTGMRKGEIITLKWSHIDLSHNVITIDQTTSKSKKQRRIPINEILRKVLLELKLRSRDSAFLFLNSDGLPYKRQDSLNRAFHLALEKARITKLRFHDLRHTAATRMVEANVPIVAVKEILGHSSLETTMRYAHPTDSLKDAVEALATHCSRSDGHNSGHIST